MGQRLLGVVVLAWTASVAAAMPPVGTQYPSRTYRIQHDTRRCASPMCGGWWIASVNASRMICPDGARRAACYVASTEWSELGLDPATEDALRQAAGLQDALVEGVVVIESVMGFDLPVLHPTRAWWDVTFTP